jgi:DNA-directed RNA polymerase subunit RPC12/RpoP
MLVHYRCGGCGAMLAAKHEFAGQWLACTLCRHKNLVPEPEQPVEEAPRPTVTTDDGDREQFAVYVAREAETQARLIARAEAFRRRGRGKIVAGLIMGFGATPMLLSIAALVTRSLFGFTITSLAVSMGCGALAALIGLNLWRSASEALEAEYERIVPLVADGIRRDLWRGYEASHQAQAAGPLPLGA